MIVIDHKVDAAYYADGRIGTRSGGFPTAGLGLAGDLEVAAPSQARAGFVVVAVFLLRWDLAESGTAGK